MCVRGLWVSVTVCLLWTSGCVAQKVYFDCGAKVDVVDVQGLILSPGFPYNYSSGTHCVWQFFVPVGHQLILELYDFDVFESPSNPTEITPLADIVNSVPTDDTVVSKGLANIHSIGGQFKESELARGEEVNQVVVQEQSTKMEITKVSNSAKMLADSLFSVPIAPQSSSPYPGARNVEEKVRNSFSLKTSRSASDPKMGDFFTASPQTATEIDEDASSNTPPTLLDACPNDVLYISDLITFSSRYCGSRRPSSSQLVFGSEDYMVEVIMELITTTHWGRGFALLFHYQNQTHGAMMGHQKSESVYDGSTSAMLGALSGAVVFSMCLVGILCVIFRPKLCPKEARSASSISSEVPEGVLNQAADVSDLQMVSSNRLEQQTGTVNDNNNHSIHNSRSHTGSSVNAAYDASEKTLEMYSNDLTELELGTDEVFVNVSTAKLPISAHTQRERFLRHSDTGPSRIFDWSSPDSALPTVTNSSVSGSTNSTRPRAWSVRTFQDLLPPLPQLHKKWCSWNSTSPFTKLVDSGLPKDGGRAKILSEAPLQSPGESSFISNASYPLTQPAQRQRRINSTSNLRRTRFNPPCFGLFSGASESSKPQGSTTTNGNTTPTQLSDMTSALSSQQQIQARLMSGEDDHVTVQVFAISEEDDHQPLVLAKHHDKPLRTSEQNMPLLMKGQFPTERGHDGMLTLEIKGPLSCKQ